MQFWKSLSGKLYGLTILLCIVSLVIGLFSLHRMSGMNDRLESLVNESAARVQLGEKIKQNLLTVSRAEKYIILSKTQEEMQKFYSVIKQAEDELNGQIESLGGLVEGDYQLILNEFKDTWEQYDATQREVVALAKLNSNQRAFALSTTEAQETYNRLEKILDQASSKSRQHLDESQKSQDAEIQELGRSAICSLLIAELGKAIATYRKTEKSIILSTTQEMMDDYAKKSAEIEAQIAGLFEQLHAIADPELKQDLPAIQSKFTAYDELNDQVRELSRENGNHRAFTLSSTTGKKLLDHADSLIAQIVTSNEKSMANDVAYNNAKYKATVFYTVITIVSGIVLGVLIAWSIVSRIVKSVQRIQTQAAAIADGDLTGEEMPVTSSDEIGELTQAINRMSASLQNVLGEVAETSNEVASASTQIAASSEELSQGVEEQMQQVMQVSTAAEEMSQSIMEVSQKAAEASNFSQDSNQRAREGGEVVQHTVDGMREISDAVRAGSRSVEELGRRGEQIGEIVTVINDIADQTNLLALNAAIEAARAGEHGRGFAVVADEVRKLADRTVKATQEITDSIEAVQKETVQAVERMQVGTETVSKGVELASSAGTSLSEITGNIHNVADMIGCIAAAAEEQSAASEEISQSIQGITEIVNQTREAATESAQAGMSMSERAECLHSLVQQFKLPGHR